jgi:hypothetical protein
MTAKGAFTKGAIAAEIEQGEPSVEARPQTQQMSEEATLARREVAQLLQNMRYKRHEVFLGL